MTGEITVYFKRGMKEVKMLNMKKWLSIIVLGILVVGSFNFVGCKKEEKVIKIGAILPLTGRQAFLGTSIKNGLLLAEKEINSSRKAQEPKIELLFEDSKGEPKEAVASINKLINIDKVKVIFAHLSTVNEAILPIVKASKVLHIAFVMDPDFAAKNRHTFTIFPTSGQEAKKMVSYILKEGIKRVGIIYARSTSHEQAINRYLVPMLSEKKIEIVGVESFEPQKKDIKNQLLKLKAKLPEVLIVFVYPTHLDMFYKQMKEIGLLGKTKILGNMSVALVTTTKVSKEDMESTIFTAPVYYMVQSGKIKEFERNYKANFGRPPEITTAAFAYDALHIVYNAMKDSKGNVEKASAQLATLKEYEGITGPLSIDTDRNALIDMRLGIIRDGKRMLLE